MVNGLKNPPNFRKSDYFSNIYFETYDYFNIQELSDYSNLWIQTNEPAQITDLVLTQSNEALGQEATYTINFPPKNRIDSDGSMLLTFPDQVEFVDTEDGFVKCQVVTYQTFSQACTIDKTARTVFIQGVFQDNYLDFINIELQLIRNPISNQELKQITI